MSLFRLIAPCCLLLWGLSLHAQLLVGRVIDSELQKPIPRASVRVKAERTGVLTDSLGFFRLRLDSAGWYELVASSVGYDAKTLSVLVSETAADTLLIGLKVASIQLNDQVVVTAQRYQTNSFERPEALTVMTQRDLLRNGLRSTPEALMGQTGIFIQKTNHGGGSPFMRGLTGQQTLLLMDGFRLNNASFRSGPNQYFNTIDPFILERIEAVRGGGSVQYGSDALGGTINLLSYSPEFSEETRVRGSAMSTWMSGDMETSGRFALGLSAKRLAVQVGYSYRDFGHLVGGKGIGRQQPSGYVQQSADVKIHLKTSARSTLTFAHQQLRQDSVPVYHKIQLEGYQLHHMSPQQRTMTYARWQGTTSSVLFSDWQVGVVKQSSSEERHLRKVGADLQINESDQVYTWGATASFLSRFTGFWSAQTGAEWYQDRVESSRSRFSLTNAFPRQSVRGLYPNDAQMSSFGLYSLHTLTFVDWVVTAGVRKSFHQLLIPTDELGEVRVTPSAWVGNLGLTYKLTPALHLVGGVNSSFRAPNIDDMGTLGIVDFRFEVPNTALNPERGLNKELGLKWKSERFSATGHYFHMNLTDLIGRTKTEEIRQGYAVYLKENSNRAFVRGWETDLEWQPADKWLFFANSTYTYGQNRSANEPLRRIPPWFGRVGLSRQVNPKFWVKSEWWYAGAQTRLAKADKDDNRIGPDGTPAWNVFNLSATYRVSLLHFTAECQNLFNEAYRTHGSGINGVGRSFWFSLRFIW